MELASKDIRASVVRQGADDATRERRLLERILLIVTVFMGFALPLLIADNDAEAAGGSPISQALWTLLYLIAIIGIVVERRTAVRLVRASLPVVLIIALAACSTFWSEDPLQTAKQSLALLGTSALALFFVCRLGLKSFIGTLAFTLTTIAVLSAILIAYFPQLGLQQDEAAGAWKGAFIGKNILGEGMVLGIVTIACSVSRSQVVRAPLQIAALLLFLFLLIGSRNTGSFIVAAALALMFVVLVQGRAFGSIKLAIFTGVLLLGAVVVAPMFGFDADKALDILGKDQTLTGRTDLWQLTISAIGERPLLGYGYAAFFDPDSPTGQEVVRALPWANTAHNGYLELMLGFGLVGSLFVLWMLVIGLRRALKFFRRNRDLSSLWPLLVMAFIILSNISEAAIARVNDVRWIVFLAAFLYATDACLRPILQSGDNSEIIHR